MNRNNFCHCEAVRIKCKVIARKFIVKAILAKFVIASPCQRQGEAIQKKQKLRSTLSLRGFEKAEAIHFSDLRIKCDSLTLGESAVRFIDSPYNIDFIWLLDLRDLDCFGESTIRLAMTDFFKFEIRN